MGETFVERQVRKTVREIFGDKAVRVFKGIGELAAQQGGRNIIENYRLLGKRTVIVASVAGAAALITASAIAHVVARRAEERRVEQIVHRVLEEERQNEEGQAGE